jgi:hypothetical protein
MTMSRMMITISGCLAQATHSEDWVRREGGASHDSFLGTETTMRGRLTTTIILAFALAATAALADPPGYDFLSFPDGMALVVGQSRQAPKGVISEEDAKALTQGAQPLSGRSIIVMYQGKFYIVPDKRMPNGEMGSQAVMSAAHAGK